MQEERERKDMVTGGSADLDPQGDAQGPGEGEISSGSGKPLFKGKAASPSGESGRVKSRGAQGTKDPSRSEAERGAGGSASSPEKEGATTGAESKTETQPGETSGERQTASHPADSAQEEMSEEDFRRLVEESLERVTVAEVTLTVMNQFASLGYLKMGLPESVNLKYRDLDQALLAIDMLEAMIKGAEGKISEESLRPFRGTLANLQLNYVQIKKRTG